MARIVETSNFDSDYPNESFVMGVMSKDSAKGITTAVNHHLSGPSEDRFWKVVGNEYELSPGFEP